MPTLPSIKSVFAPIFAQEFPPSYGIVILDGEPKTFSRNEIDTLDTRYYYAGDDANDNPTIARKANV